MSYGTVAMVKERLGMVEASGTADSGSETTLVDSIRVEEDAAWVGYVLTIVAGTNEGETRKISAFVKLTHTITVSSVFSAAIDSTSRYIISEDAHDAELLNGLAYGDGYIDSLVSPYGSVPASAPQIVKDASADFAAFYYLRNRAPERSTTFFEIAMRVVEVYLRVTWKKGVVIRTTKA